jgi:glycine cleavage system H protein
LFVELPNVGDKFDSGESFARQPGSQRFSGNINEDAYSAWLIELRMSSPKELDSLMTAEEYDAYIAAEPN